MSFGMFLVVGKRGKKRASLLKEGTDNECGRGHNSAALIWSNNARRCLVDPTVLGLPRIVGLCCLFDVGCVSGWALFFRQLHLAILLARAFRRLAPQLVW